MEVVGNTWNCPGPKCSNIESPVDWILRSCEDSRARILQTMPRLEDLKEQCHRVGLGQSVKRLMNLVITPSTVPDFTIPRSYNNTCTGAPPSSTTTLSPGHSCESLNDSYDQLPAPTHQSSPLLGRPPAVTMREGRVGGPLHAGRPLSSHQGMKRSTSAPATPGPHLRGSPEGSMFRRSHTISYEMIDDAHQATTNADPCSLAAMSLPHLKTKTKFGFETLSECPTTLRKESLFHDPDSTRGSASRMQAKLSALRELQNKRCGSREEVTTAPADCSLEHSKRVRSRRRNVVYQVAPLGVSISPLTSTEGNISSTGSSPAHSRTASVDRVQQSEDVSSTTSSPTLTERRRRFHRRRPATVSEDDLTPWQQSTLLMPEERAEAGQRRYSGFNISLNEEDVQQLWRVSALTATVGVSRSFPGVSNSAPADSLEGGLSPLIISSWERKSQLKFALEYSGKKKQLLVHLQEGISLPGPPDATNAFFMKIHLHPLSNAQRHTSNVVRQTNDPVFDQTFPFTEISREQLLTMKLRVKVFRKEGLLRRNESVGELEVNLSELDFAEQARYELLRDIETEEIPQELGRLQTKIRFQANCETLDVTLLQIKDLPCNSMARAPDPYVTLELRQPGRPDIRIQSKIKKKVTSSPINETFSLRISPRIEDLNYTSLSLTVYDREMIRSDRVIGEVRLGFGATEKSEFDQWNQVLSCPGAEIESWHMLMEEQ